MEIYESEIDSCSVTRAKKEGVWVASLIINESYTLYYFPLSTSAQPVGRQPRRLDQRYDYYEWVIGGCLACQSVSSGSSD